MKFTMLAFLLTISPATAQSLEPVSDKWGCQMVPFTTVNMETGERQIRATSAGIYWEHKCTATVSNVVKVQCLARCNITSSMLDYFIAADDGHFYLPREVLEGAKLLGAREGE